MRILLTLLLIALGFSGLHAQLFSDDIRPDYYEIAPDRIYFMPAGSESNLQLTEILGDFDIFYSEPAFSLHSSMGLLSEEGQRLSRIQIAYLGNYADPERISRQLSLLDDIAWAEPVVIPHTLHTPNDPQFSQNQSYLNLINATEAWAVTRGDTNIVIAIVDTGVDYLHEDLYPNVWRNPNETENGQDDSGSGKIDDIHGWDFFENNNNPIPASSAHGTHVAGIAAAATNNAKGVASLGYNTRFMALKVSDGAGSSLPFAYQGVIYAAEQGADIINCSWGSKRFSRVAEQIINYASSLGSIVVAAAGNDNSSEIFYPAGFASAISVGSITLNKVKSGFSSYSPAVNVSAPGTQIYSTFLNNSYGFSSGTSMAAPLVSALAALVKAAHPEFSNEQIRAQILASTSIILYGSNDPWRNQLGTGYINAGKAVGAELGYVEIIDYSFTDRRGNNDGFPEPGENIEINLSLKGFGIPGRAQIRATALDQYLLVEQHNTPLSAIARGDTLYLPDIPLRVSSQAALQSDIRSVLNLEFIFESGERYNRTAEILLNPSQYTFAINSINLTIGGEGQIGYIDGPGGNKGTGFVIQGQASTSETQRLDIFDKPMLFEGGLMLGNQLGADGAFVANAVRGPAQGTLDRDFLIREPFKVLSTPDGTAVKTEVVFTDGNAGQNAYGLTITQTSWASNSPGHEQYILLNYNFFNASNNDYNYFIGGLFLDFDAMPSRKNVNYGYYVEEDDLLVVAENNSGDENVLMLGVTVMSGLHTPFLIDNTGNSGPFGINDGFQMRHKAVSLWGGKISTARKNTDVSVVAAPIERTLARATSREETFVLAWGLGYDDLLAQINKARSTYEVILSSDNYDFAHIPGKTAISALYPNPFNPATNITIEIQQSGHYSLELFDVTGRKVQTIVNQHFSEGSHRLQLNASQLSSGVYVVRLTGGGQLFSSRLVTLVK